MFKRKRQISFILIEYSISPTNLLPKQTTGPKTKLDERFTGFGQITDVVFDSFSFRIRTFRKKRPRQRRTGETQAAVVET